MAKYIEQPPTQPIEHIYPMQSVPVDSRNPGGAYELRRNTLEPMIGATLADKVAWSLEYHLGQPVAECSIGQLEAAVAGMTEQFDRLKAENEAAHQQDIAGWHAAQAKLEALIVEAKGCSVGLQNRLLRNLEKELHDLVQWQKPKQERSIALSLHLALPAAKSALKDAQGKRSARLAQLKSELEDLGVAL